MKLLTKEIEQKFEKIGQQDNVDDQIVVCKFFTPWSNWTWYATEYNPSEKTFFGYVVGQEKEWGYFSLDEFLTVKGPAGLGIERDKFFKSGKFSEVVPKEHQ